MKRRKINSQVEQRIITAMIVSEEFASRSLPTLDLSLIKTDHLRLIAKWAKNYFNKYGKAPGKHMEPIFYAWAEKNEGRPELVESVHDVLSGLSDQYEDRGGINVPYLLDEAGEMFSLRKIELLKDELEYTLTQGTRDEAEAAILGYSSINLSAGQGVDPLNDLGVWKAAWADSQKPLLQFGDPDADRFISPALTRDSLIGVMGPEKRGKTWWCLEFVIRSLINHRKVALFEVGDMSEAQIVRRMGVRFARRPLYRRDCGRIEYPRAILRDEEVVDVETSPLECNKPCSLLACKRALRNFWVRSGLKEGTTYFMLSVHPNSSINVAQIGGILKRWAAERDFIPDVVIIDYPDILAPEPTTAKQTTRDQVNDTWRAMRRLSQEQHCSVIAPTQANAASYQTDLLGMSNFSEDKRKLAHVTGMLGLNQTYEEKVRGIMRLNWIALRESPFLPDRCLYVGQCLPLGRAYCCSSL